MDCASCDDCVFDGSDIPSNIHEIHVTVRTYDVDHFVDTCHANAIKPIVIAYQHNKTGNDLTDVMTSQRFTGTNEAALEEAQIIGKILNAHGMGPIRTKIETTPTNPVVKEGKGYFESHIAVKVPIDGDMNAFRSIMQSISTALHVSKNAFKTDNAGSTFMVTYRAGGISLERFAINVNDYTNLINAMGYKTGKVITEYCWYDDNQSHDVNWMGE